MRFKQVSGLLTSLADARLALQQMYGRLAHQVDSSRTRMLLEYLARREQQARDALLRYQQEAPPGLLATWLGHAFDCQLTARVRHTDIDGDASPNDVLALALSLDHELIGLLGQQAVLAPTPEVRDALVALLAEEQQRQRQLVLNLARFEDV